MPRSDFRPKLVSLWFRLISIGIIAFVFAEALFLAPGKVQGWSYYLSPLEVVFEVAVRLIFAASAGIALGTICTAAIAPLLWHFRSSRENVIEWATKVAVVLVVFLDSRFALTTLITWSNHGVRFKPILLIAHFVAFGIALSIPRIRKEVVTSLDGFVGEGKSLRTAVATVFGAVALVGMEFVLGAMAPTVKAAPVSLSPKHNFLLITFDALNAEDMSLYGRKLPTTPNIDAFARQATVFTNFYSTTTFTTPSIATMMTGMYPSETHVYHLQGRLGMKDAGRSLPHSMQAAGYVTGAFLSNPYAYHLARSIENGYDFLPEPTFQTGGLEHLWNATRPLHQDSRIGSRIDEYFDLEYVWNFLWRIPGNLAMRLRPDASFEQARAMLDKLPDGFFFWVHVITPHNPYLPDPQERGRFLPADKVHTFEEQFGGRWKPHFGPDQQSAVDERRLRYDEFIASADRAFGDFLSQLESDGKLRNTIVIVSADHGESFEGGVYQHSSPELTRPVIHIPLIIRTPEQQQGRRIALAADQTALAPTILDLAGHSRLEGISGQSLVKWLKGDDDGQGQGLAFSQYLERNSVFQPVRNGTLSVIDGQYQYVVDISTKKGALRPLSEAHVWNLDRTAENPARAAALRAAIYSRFPDLLHK